MDEGPDAGSATSWEEQRAEFWARRRGAVLERVARLQTLASAVSPDEAAIEEGRVEAHKLRGLLGTLGLAEGSEVAGEIEDALAAHDTEVARDVERLGALVRDYEPRSS